ncbi:hypothetical protein FRC10_003349 [Ceratobasidium sp. 414]|nr:hypothetical protein FRC10_003349 [Ceratobasidium sp. 414]
MTQADSRPQNFPPFSSDAKVKYLIVDLHRNVQELQLNWNLDMSRTPVPSLSDMSTLSALKGLLPPEQFKEIIGKLFAERVANVSPPPNTFACLVPSHVSQDTLDKAKELSQTREFADSFEKEHQVLLNDYGTFGVPWTLLQRPGGDRYESFWGRPVNIGFVITLNSDVDMPTGSDRMASMAHWLGPNYVYTGASPKTI